MKSVNDDVRWLDADEQRAWRAFLRIRRDLDAELGRRLRSRGQMDILDYELLVILSEAPDRRLPMGELAAESTTSASRLTYRVDRLAERGWVDRCASPSDARSTLAILTDAGFSALEIAAPDHLRDVRTLLFDHVEPGELKPVADALERIADRLAT